MVIAAADTLADTGIRPYMTPLFFYFEAASSLAFSGGLSGEDWKNGFLQESSLAALGMARLP